VKYADNQSVSEGWRSANLAGERPIEATPEYLPHRKPINRVDELLNANINMYALIKANY